MNTLSRQTTLILALAGAAVVAATVIFTPGCTCAPSGGAPDNIFTRAKAKRYRDKMAEPIGIERITYHGWTNSLRMGNGHIEVIVVPEIGRLMSFRRLHGENVLWEDHVLEGLGGSSNGNEWVNFGGEKTWPAPEGEWGNYTGKKIWMPPTSFDGLPYTASIESKSVTLLSSTDPNYGIRARRQISIQSTTLQITTTYEKLSGEPCKVGIWTIAQFKSPIAVCAPGASNSVWPTIHRQFGKEPWPDLIDHGEFIEVRRDRNAAHKLGNNAKRLLWVGEKELCLVDGGGNSIHPSGYKTNVEEYPDGGSLFEIYTNPDPKQYVELESLGPLSVLKRGDIISYSGSYTLMERAGRSPHEASRLYLNVRH